MSERRRTREGSDQAELAAPASEQVQLRLLNGDGGRAQWRLDETTRRRGRQGVAEAREILRRAQPPAPLGRARAS